MKWTRISHSHALQLQQKQFGSKEPISLEDQLSSWAFRSRSLPSNAPSMLPKELQYIAERTLGTDLSTIRIHPDSQQSVSLGARAFTQGENIHFAPGQFHPESPDGQDLIAHELVHVLQQREGRVRPTTKKSGIAVNDDSSLELEADKLGSKIGAAQFRAPVQSSTQRAMPPIAMEPVQLKKKEPLPAYDPYSLLSPDDKRSQIWVDVMELGSEFLTTSWHNYLAIQQKRGPGLPKYGDGAISDEAVDQFLKSITETLDATTFPTNNPLAGFNKHRDGYRYMARAHRNNPASVSHAQWNRNVSLAETGIANPTTQQETVWRHFQVVMSEEGDTSAINAWDGQIVTLGAGFGGLYAQANELMARLPAAYRMHLYKVGMHFTDSGELYYLDVKHKRVLTGRDAWYGIKSNPKLVAYWVQLAQSDQEIEWSENQTSPMKFRNWMLKAQFEQFYQNNEAWIGTRIEQAPFNVRMLLMKLHHWLPGVFNWDDLRNCPHAFGAAIVWTRRILIGAGYESSLGQFNAMNRFAALDSEQAIDDYMDQQLRR